MLLASKSGEDRHSPWFDLTSGFGGVTPQLKAVLLSTTETPAAKALAQSIWDSQNWIAVHAATPTTLSRHATVIAAGSALPIGDKALTLACLEIAKVVKPNWSAYPQALLPHMQHLPRLTTASATLRWPKPAFVRPARGGDFRGFVMREALDEMSADDRVSLEKLLSLSRSSPVWVSGALEILCVWRYYVLDGELLGYELVQGAGVREPESEEVSAIIATAPQDTPYLLDMAILRDGSTTLLRTRDALDMEYPMGAGRHAPTPLDFLRLSWSRWTQLYLNSRASRSRSTS